MKNINQVAEMNSFRREVDELRDSFLGKIGDVIELHKHLLRQQNHSEEAITLGCEDALYLLNDGRKE